jgi:hypothetical protein
MSIGYFVQFYDSDRKPILGTSGGGFIRNSKSGVKYARRRAAGMLRGSSQAKTFEIFRVNPERYYDLSQYELVSRGHVGHLRGLIKAKGSSR